MNSEFDEIRRVSIKMKGNSFIVSGIWFFDFPYYFGYVFIECESNGTI